MKLSTLIDAQFQAAVKKLTTQELPLRTAFSLKGIVKRINEELNKYDEVRSEALNRLGDKKEDGSLNANEQGIVKLSEDNAKSFIAELSILQASDVNVGSLKVSDLGDKAFLTVNDLNILEPLITD